MENLVNKKLFNSVYLNKKVFLTGHTGFKGSWMALWLKELGADVLGFSHDVPSHPNHYDLLNLEIASIKGDIRNKDLLFKVISDFKPDIIFHLAAQPLVRHSYKNPLETFETNILGTANVFEAASRCESVKAIVNVTSDKAYENSEDDVAYKETDRMGGYDPYSASKGCAELLANCYRNSFFNLDKYKVTHQILLASARAGNVIGGGDWAADRLIPDIVRMSAGNGEVIIRNPRATRPWQHVLEPLSGYLLLGQHLLEERREFAEGWNFGPNENETLKVIEVLEKMQGIWNNFKFKVQQDSNDPHEAHLLRLDCSKANVKLGWCPIWDMDRAISKTAIWYKKFYENGIVSTKEDLEEYIVEAKSKKIKWTL